ncbi:MAG: site-specific integrase [Desulfovibrio sp.]|nr:site-specific integrase [Desulfovibrio sp.]
MPRNLALYQSVALYLDEEGQRRKRNTVVYKRTVLRRLIAFFGENARLEEIDRRSLNDFLLFIAEKVSKKSANKYKVVLSAFWAWANIEGYCQGNPPRQIETFPTQRHVKYVPPQEHIMKALNAASPFARSFMLAIVHTAGRVSEVRELAWEDVDLERRTVRLWTSKRRGGNRESRTLPLSKTLFDVLAAMNAERTGGEAYVFTNQLTGTCYSRQGREIKYLFHRVCEKAEVPLFTAHSLRHFVATYFNDPRRAQKILGHENLKTTEMYLHDLGVDVGAADVFESITHEITHGDDSESKKGSTVLQ